MVTEEQLSGQTPAGNGTGIHTPWATPWTAAQTDNCEGLGNEKHPETEAQEMTIRMHRREGRALFYTFPLIWIQ